MVPYKRGVTKTYNPKLYKDVIWFQLMMLSRDSIASDQSYTN